MYGPKKQPGLHQSMVLAMSNVCTKKNNVDRTSTWLTISIKQDILGKLCHIMNLAVNRMQLVLSLFIWRLFRFQNSVQKANLVASHSPKYCFTFGLNNLIEVKEKCIKSYFQTCSDIGCSADHTQKWSKVIRASGQQGKLFTMNLMFWDWKERFASIEPRSQKVILN